MMKRKVLNTLRIVLSVIGAALACYVLVFQRYELMAYLLLIVGISTLTSGWIEVQKNQKGFRGYLCIITALFAFFVSIEWFFVN
ncbi:DUF3953 domain-containing protein [Halobacillus sp. B23F22_1]|uniref:DUF3953 domain-containing protein n=1 Tax=Halobacillus sp. B23F22_1 TaxID=3459514 RepID=UPI00373E3E8F